MLKVRQSKKAPWLAVTVSCDPLECALAEPATTVIPCGLARAAEGNSNMRRILFIAQNWKPTLK
jgi:hypothetical protein